MTQVAESIVRIEVKRDPHFSVGEKDVYYSTYLRVYKVEVVSQREIKDPLNKAKDGIIIHGNEHLDEGYRGIIEEYCGTVEDKVYNIVFYTHEYKITYLEEGKECTSVVIENRLHKLCN